MVVINKWDRVDERKWTEETYTDEVCGESGGAQRGGPRRRTQTRCVERGSPRGGVVCTTGWDVGQDSLPEGDGSDQWKPSTCLPYACYMPSTCTCA